MINKKQIPYVGNIVLYLVGNRLDLLAFQGSNDLYPRVGVLTSNRDEVGINKLVCGIDNAVTVVNVDPLPCFVEVRTILVELFFDLLKEASNVRIHI